MKKYNIEQYQKKIIALNKKIVATRRKWSKADRNDEELNLKYRYIVLRWSIKLQNYKREQGILIDQNILRNILGEYPYLDDFNDANPLEYRLSQFRELTTEKINTFFEEYDKNKRDKDFMSRVTCDKETICELKFEDEK